MYVSVKWKVNFLATHLHDVPAKQCTLSIIMGENDDLKKS